MTSGHQPCDRHDLAETSEWAGEYQGYNLDELVQDVNEALATVTEMETDVDNLKEDFNDMLLFKG